MCFTASLNGLEEENSEDTKTENEPKKKQKTQTELPTEGTTSEDTPLKKKKKKKRKLADTTETPGNSKMFLQTCFDKVWFDLKWKQ